jgi:hypothetical protein
VCRTYCREWASFSACTPSVELSTPAGAECNPSICRQLRQAPYERCALLYVSVPRTASDPHAFRKLQERIALKRATLLASAQFWCLASSCSCCFDRQSRTAIGDEEIENRDYLVWFAPGRRLARSENGLNAARGRSGEEEPDGVLLCHIAGVNSTIDLVSPASEEAKRKRLQRLHDTCDRYCAPANQSRPGVTGILRYFLT